MPDLPLLRVTSSLIFLPAFIALALGRWTDVVVISTQGICSVWFHSTHSKLSLYADQTSILILATHTLGLALTNSVTPYLFVLGFGYMAVVFSYGKRNNCFCFDPDETVGNRYHASIHVLGITIYSVSMIFFLK